MQSFSIWKRLATQILVTGVTYNALLSFAASLLKNVSNNMFQVSKAFSKLLSINCSDQLLTVASDLVIVGSESQHQNFPFLSHVLVPIVSPQCSTPPLRITLHLPNCPKKYVASINRITLMTRVSSFKTAWSPFFSTGLWLKHEYEVLVPVSLNS